MCVCARASVCVCVCVYFTMSLMHLMHLMRACARKKKRKLPGVLRRSDATSEGGRRHLL